ncbi:MAG: hypothetical protein RMJ43_01130 [Chloroherpetonaceae bacterium]|nr:hypothetical protein [Chthonomonadaceae bacterium]MDW8206412.1 hypothetical protein [Chloroherpetonaceae bacterium]
MRDRPGPAPGSAMTPPVREATEICRRIDPFEKPGEVRCPVCYQIIPPEHLGHKMHCRRCGYLESCCNPI